MLVFPDSPVFPTNILTNLPKKKTPPLPCGKMEEEIEERNDDRLFVPLLSIRLSNVDDYSGCMILEGFYLTLTRLGSFVCVSGMCY